MPEVGEKHKQASYLTRKLCRSLLGSLAAQKDNKSWMWRALARWPPVSAEWEYAKRNKDEDIDVGIYARISLHNFAVYHDHRLIRSEHGRVRMLADSDARQQAYSGCNNNKYECSTHIIVNSVKQTRRCVFIASSNASSKRSP